VEFVSYSEAWAALQQQGLEEAERTDTELHLALRESPHLVVIDIAASDHRLAVSLPPEVSRVPRQAMPAIVEGLAHRLRLDPVLIIPVGRWREVFEAVSSGMAPNETWMAIDQMASVELNTRDPIMLGPVDHMTLRDLLRVILTDGTKDTQGVSVAAPGSSLLIEVLPSGQMILFMGNAHLAVTAREVIDHAVAAATATGDSTPSPDAEKKAPQRRHS